MHSFPPRLQTPFVNAEGPRNLQNSGTKAFPFPSLPFPSVLRNKHQKQLLSRQLRLSTWFCRHALIVPNSLSIGAVLIGLDFEILPQASAGRSQARWVACEELRHRMMHACMLFLFPRQIQIQNQNHTAHSPHVKPLTTTPPPDPASDTPSAPSSPPPPQGRNPCPCPGRGRARRTAAGPVAAIAAVAVGRRRRRAVPASAAGRWRSGGGVAGRRGRIGTVGCCCCCREAGRVRALRRRRRDLLKTPWRLKPRRGR